jgi:hypothetical protein
MMPEDAQGLSLMAEQGRYNNIMIDFLLLAIKYLLDFSPKIIDVVPLVKLSSTMIDLEYCTTGTKYVW